MWGNLTPTNIGTVMVAPPICYTDAVRTGFEPASTSGMGSLTAKRDCTFPQDSVTCHSV